MGPNSEKLDGIYSQSRGAGSAVNAEVRGQHWFMVAVTLSQLIGIGLRSFEIIGSDQLMLIGSFGVGAIASRLWAPNVKPHRTTAEHG